MPNEVASTEQPTESSTGRTASTRLILNGQRSAKLAFALVIVMLGVLLFLIALLLWLPSSSKTVDNGILDYWKAALTGLYGLFGAWIGAGAAYFFGKENLAESGRSTEEALRIQLAGLGNIVRRHRIRDLPLTTLNRDFMFTRNTKKDSVLAGLDKNPGYWWVPVFDKSDAAGKIEDIIHARVFWDSHVDPNETVEKIISRLEDPTEKELRALKRFHGPSFFARVSLDDAVSEELAAMEELGAVVGIVEDSKGTPTYCFTKQDMLTAKKGWEASARS